MCEGSCRCVAVSCARPQAGMLGTAWSLTVPGGGDLPPRTGPRYGSAVAEGPDGLCSRLLTCLPAAPWGGAPVPSGLANMLSFIEAKIGDGHILSFVLFPRLPRRFAMSVF